MVATIDLPGPQLHPGLRRPNPQPELALPQRPIWVMEVGYPKLAGTIGPGGAATAQSPDLQLRRTASRRDRRHGLAGHGRANRASTGLSYELSAGLGLDTKAVDASGGTPGGILPVRITDRAGPDQGGRRRQCRTIDPAGAASAEAEGSELTGRIFWPCRNPDHAIASCPFPLSAGVLRPDPGDQRLRQRSRRTGCHAESDHGGGKRGRCERRGRARTVATGRDRQLQPAGRGKGRSGLPAADVRGRAGRRDPGDPAGQETGPAFPQHQAGSSSPEASRACSRSASRPTTARRKRFYVYYTDTTGDIRSTSSSG